MGWTIKEKPMIREILEAQVKTFETFKHPSIMERFVLRNTDGEKVGVPFTEERGEAKMCFMNATHMAAETYLPYVEGYCMRDDIGFAFHHAWCVDGGEIVDPTLTEPEKYHYLGVEIPYDELRNEIRKNGVYGVLDSEMINYRYMFKRDPGLKEIVEKIIGQEIVIKEPKRRRA